MPGNLLIDDQRNPADFPGITRVAKNYTEAIDALQNDGPWEFVWFDHDLGNTESGDKTGYDVMCWLERNPQFIPVHMALCTQNAVGRQKMKVLGQRLTEMRKAAQSENLRGMLDQKTGSEWDEQK